MNLEAQLRNSVKAWALWMPLPPEQKATIFYDLYRDIFTRVSGGSGFFNFGFQTTEPGLRAAQEELCRQTVRSLPRPGRWLEVGCGVGAAGCLLAEENREVQITGLDIGPGQIAAARRRLAERQLDGRVVFEIGDACRMPFRGRHLFDGAYAIETAFHYRDKPAFARELARVLVPEGRLAFADIVFSDGQVVRPERALLRYVHAGIGIARMFTAQQWRQTLAAASFREIEIEDISAETFGSLDRWGRRFEEVRPELEESYPAAILASTQWNVRWLAARLDRGQLRYVLITARAG